MQIGTGTGIYNDFRIFLMIFNYSIKFLVRMLCKGKINVVNIVGFSVFEIICLKIDGFLKCWDSFIDFVNILKFEICDG